MRLINKSIQLNNETFEPELEVTIRVRLEAVQDGKVLDPNFYENFGKEFATLLSSPVSQ